MISYESAVAQLEEASQKANEARARLAVAKTAKARRDADEDLCFWSSKAANMAAARNLALSSEGVVTLMDVRFEKTIARIMGA